MNYEYINDLRRIIRNGTKIIPAPVIFIGVNAPAGVSVLKILLNYQLSRNTLQSEKLPSMV
jgi:hypothetical protein